MEADSASLRLDMARSPVMIVAGLGGGYAVGLAPDERPLSAINSG